MGKSHHFHKFVFVLLLGISPVKADEIVVETLSQGACWLQQGDFLRVASFNDKEAMTSSRALLERDVSRLVENKLKMKSLGPEENSDITLHCGSAGASLIFKMKFNDISVCAWTKIAKGKIELRSLGGVAFDEGQFCDGYALGELIVGIKSPEDLLDFDFLTYAKSTHLISENVFKVVLKEEYLGRELEVLTALKKSQNFRYVELSTFQHPIGDFIKLK